MTVRVPSNWNNKYYGDDKYYDNSEQGSSGATSIVYNKISNGQITDYSRYKEECKYGWIFFLLEKRQTTF